MWPDAPILTGEQTVALAETFMPEAYKEELNTRGDCDFAYENVAEFAGEKAPLKVTPRLPAAGVK